MNYFGSSNNAFLVEEIRIPDLEKFDGKIKNYISFKSALEIQYWMYPECFSIDKNKISYIGNHLKNTAGI
ncbi:hypothetical protein AYI70_g3274 [Smittium culicis]|uniref:Uncharacterized protein n=1 Tax=Smittium culicis TaxID=133412 RepID=A0A1R1Y4T1_9FUNG|nr:hypothetical protein AYI70_g3274 [Smittium culicis]